MRRSGLEGLRIAGRYQADTTGASNCRDDAARSGLQQSLRLPRHSLTVFNQSRRSPPAPADVR